METPHPANPQPGEAEAEVEIELESHYFSDPRIKLEAAPSNEPAFRGEAALRLPPMLGHHVWRNDLNQCFQHYHPPGDCLPELHMLVAISSTADTPWHQRCAILPCTPINCRVNRFAVFVQVDARDWLVLPIENGLFIPLRRYQFEVSPADGNTALNRLARIQVHPSLPLVYWRTWELNEKTKLKEHALCYAMVTSDHFVWDRMVLNFPYHHALRIVWELEKTEKELYPRLVARLHQPLVVMRKSGDDDSSEFFCSVYDGKFMQILADGQAEQLRVQDTTNRMMQVMAKFDMCQDKDPEAGFYFEQKVFGADALTLEQYRKASDCQILCSFHSDVPKFYDDHPLSPLKRFGIVETEEERREREDLDWQEKLLAEERECLARVQRELDEKAEKASQMEEAERLAEAERERKQRDLETYYVHSQGTTQKNETCVCDVCTRMDKKYEAESAEQEDEEKQGENAEEQVEEVKPTAENYAFRLPSDADLQPNAADDAALAAAELLDACALVEGNSESGPPQHSTHSASIEVRPLTKNDVSDDSSPADGGDLIVNAV